MTSWKLIFVICPVVSSHLSYGPLQIEFCDWTGSKFTLTLLQNPHIDLLQIYLWNMTRCISIFAEQPVWKWQENIDPLTIYYYEKCSLLQYDQLQVDYLNIIDYKLTRWRNVTKYFVYHVSVSWSSADITYLHPSFDDISGHLRTLTGELLTECWLYFTGQALP